MLELIMVRHGRTAGNLLRRYIGVTDEELVSFERERLLPYRQVKGLERVEVEHVFTSPLIRCLQTADLIFPGLPRDIVEDLRECDFGEFENKNYRELEGLASYQAWVDSQGCLPFPGGESREGFQRRCLSGLEEVVRRCRESGIRSAALTVHGGTIMSVMERIARPSRAYYDWHVDNAEGFHFFLEEEGEPAVKELLTPEDKICLYQRREDA